MSTPPLLVTRPPAIQRSLLGAFADGRCPVLCGLEDSVRPGYRDLHHRCLDSTDGHTGPCYFLPACGRSKGPNVHELIPAPRADREEVPFAHMELEADPVPVRRGAEARAAGVRLAP